MSPHQHISYCVNKDLMGTARYSSINMHLGISEPHGRTWHQFTHLPGFEDGDWAPLALRVVVVCALTISSLSLQSSLGGKTWSPWTMYFKLGFVLRYLTWAPSPGHG